LGKAADGEGTVTADIVQFPQGNGAREALIKIIAASINGEEPEQIVDWILGQVYEAGFVIMPVELSA
jgi:hypothetical protein